MTWWQRLVKRQKVEQELDAEIRFHVNQLFERYIREGMSELEARRRAQLEFGGVESIKEECRESTRMRMVEQTWQDLVYGARMLTRNWGFTLTALLSLAIGIGANTSVFSVIDVLLLKKLPVMNSHELISFTKTDPDSPLPSIYFPYQQFERLRDRTTNSATVFGYLGVSNTPFRFPGETLDTSTERVRVDRVTANYFSVLGVTAAAGRTFNDTDVEPADSDLVAVLSYEFWTRRFNQDPGVIGRQIVVLRDIPFTVIGVAQPGFTGVNVDGRTSVWWPIENMRRLPNSNLMETSVSIMSRLRPSVSLEKAEAEGSVVYAGLLQEDVMAQPNWNASRRRSFLSQRLKLEPGSTGQSDSLRSRYRQPLAALIGTVAVVLFCASVNVAGLLLARGTARRRELTVRLMLGSGRFRIVRQLLTESILLGTLAVLGSFVVAHFGIQILISYAPVTAVDSLRPGLNLRVLAFAAVAALASMAVFAILPAFHATNLARPRSRSGLNKVLVCLQIAVSMMLLACAGLLERSLTNLRESETGFDKQNVTIFAVNNGTIRPAVAKEMMPLIEGIPGVRSATHFVNIGLLGGNAVQSECVVDGTVPVSTDQIGCVVMNVGLRFFDTTGIQVVQGRDFTHLDEQTNATVAIISATMARQYFGDGTAIGRRMKGMEIIGVAEDVKYSSLREETRRVFYSPLWKGILFPDLRFAVRTDANVPGLVDAVRSVVRQVAPQFQVTRSQTMDEIAEGTLLRERLLVQFSGFFSVLAIVLSSIGLYGTMSCAVASRTNEIGIRMALGAKVARVIGMVMGETAIIVGIGIIAGLFGASAAMRLIRGLLFGVDPMDPTTLVGAVLILVAASAIAAYLPARRASHIDPLLALRHE